MGSDEPTRVALLTPPARGAVASIVVAGPAAAARVAKLVALNRASGLEQAPLRKILAGRWQEKEGEEIVVCRRAEDRVEIHCHGGTAAAERIVGDLIEAGCQRVSWQDWAASETRGAFAAAAASQLPYAPTQRTAAILLDQLQGALTTELQTVEGRLSAGDVATSLEQLETLLNRAPLGRHLVEPWRVVIAGPPNAGKSTLLNAILGFSRAIVFDQPGTTRDVVTATTVLDGWPIELADTAGLRDTSDELESAGIARAQSRLQSADLVLLVFDAGVPLTGDELRLCDSVPAALRIRNKIDLVGDSPTVRDGWLSVSARTGDGMEKLMSAIVARLVPAVPPPGAGLPITPQQEHEIGEVLAMCRASELGAAAARVRSLLSGLSPPSRE
jgi:tRNA modification GTPase